ncbi:hypothetical protein ACFFX0_26270 [Citricoccus parietis]|uniref:Uncharacterized protein n=1 Tax=Citricoccus parietis TaxID=592307 RepID=A0ABV5G7A8_9MICC
MFCSTYDLFSNILWRREVGHGARCLQLWRRTEGPGDGAVGVNCGGHAESGRGHPDRGRGGPGLLRSR